jgi:hypothetical protein
MAKIHQRLADFLLHRNSVIPLSYLTATIQRSGPRGQKRTYSCSVSPFFTKFFLSETDNAELGRKPGSLGGQPENLTRSPVGLACPPDRDRYLPPAGTGPMSGNSLHPPETGPSCRGQALSGRDSPPFRVKGTYSQ